MPAHSDHNPEPNGVSLPVEWLDFVLEDGPEIGPSAALPQNFPLGSPIASLSDDELALRLRVLATSSDSSWLKDAALRAEAFAALRRAVAHRRALSSVKPKAAPAELAGLVVASLHPGARQDRAVRHLEALASLPAPRDLDEAVARMVISGGPTGKLRSDADSTPTPGALRAPGVLDRLVEESLADPAKSSSKSMTRRLGRQSAPDELDERVESSLQPVDKLDSNSWSQEAAQGAANAAEPIGARNLTAALVSMALAIALVVALGLQSFGGKASESIDGNVASGEPTLESPSTGSPMPGGDEPDRPKARLEIVVLHEDNLSTDDRNMLRLLGGAL